MRIIRLPSMSDHSIVVARSTLDVYGFSFSTFVEVLFLVLVVLVLVLVWGD